MATILDTQTGQTAEVPDEVAHAQLPSSDRYVDVSSGRVQVLDQNGQRGDVDLSEFTVALKRGYRPLAGAQLEEERLQAKYGNQALQAGAAGVARGATLGISDVALTKEGLVSPQTLRELKKRNPGASTAGEMGGVVAATALTRGRNLTPAGLVARGATAVGTEVAANFAGRALVRETVAGALEGGLQNLGSLVSEHALEETPNLTAQRALAAFGTGALFGGTFGAGVGAVDDALAQRTLGRMAEEAPEVARAAGAVDDAAEAAPAVPRAPEAAPAAPPSPGSAVPPAEEVTRAATPKAKAAAAPADPMGSPEAFDQALGAVGGAAERFRKGAEEAATKNVGTLQRIWDALDLGKLDPREFVVRAYDLKSQALGRMRKKGDLDLKAAEFLLQDGRFAAARSPQARLELLEKMVQENGEAIGSAVRKMDEIADPGELFSPADFAAKARQELVAPLAKGTVDQRRAARRVEAEVRALLDRANIGTKDAPAIRELGFSEVEEVKRALDESLKWDSMTPNVTRDNLRKLRGMLNADQEARVGALSERAGEDLLTGWKQAKDKYGALYEFQQAALKRLEDAKKANRVFSLTDNIFGAAMAAVGGGLNPVGIGMGLGAMLVNKWGRERLPHVLALALWNMERNPGQNMAARAFRKLVLEGDEATAATAGSATARAERAAAEAVPEGVAATATRAAAAEEAAGAAAANVGAGAAADVGASVAGASQRFGPFTGLLRRAAALGAGELWAVHTALSAEPAYRAQLEAAGIPAGPAADKQGLERAAQLGRLQAAMLSGDQRLDRAIDAMASGQRPPVKPADLGRAKEQAEQLVRLAGNPEKLVAELGRRTAELSRTAPATSAAMVETAQRALSFLSAKAPKRQEPPLDVPQLQRPWKPTALELQRFAGNLAGALDPLGTLEDVAAGRVSREQVEALRTVYPELYQHVRERLVAKLSEAGSRKDYQRRLGYAQSLALGRLLDLPLVKAAEPQTLATTQAMYQAEAQQQNRKRPAPSTAGAQKTISQGFTESQRLASKN